MTIPIKKRAYGKLRDIIQGKGGKMEYRRQGYEHGAWEISLNGKRAVIEAIGKRTFPEFDALFKPGIPNPKTWDDYRNELVERAEEKFLALLK